MILRGWVKNYLAQTCRNPSLLDYFIGRTMTDLQMICHVIHWDSFIRQNHFNTRSMLSSAVDVDGRPIPASWLTLVRLSLNFSIHSFILLWDKTLFPYVHKVFNKGTLQITKNISLHAALLLCKSHMWSSHFFLRNYKWTNTFTPTYRIAVILNGEHW